MDYADYDSQQAPNYYQNNFDQNLNPNNLNQNYVYRKEAASFYTQLQQLITSSIQNSSNLTIYVVSFLALNFIVLIIFFLYYCLCKSSSLKSSLKSSICSLEESPTWNQDYVPFLKRKLKKKLTKNKLVDALISDNHSMQSDDYEDFLKYKAKKMKYRHEMEAQSKRLNRSKNNKNLINYNFLNSDPDYEKITRDQISKLARKEAQNCLIDLDGIEHGKLVKR